MIVGMLLLDQNDIYARDNGTLPKRPSFDKELLTGVCEKQNALCSANTAEYLPKSITNIIRNLNVGGLQGDVALSPDMIDKHAHLLIITRNDETGTGKRFRFDKFKCLVKDNAIEIWCRDYEGK